MFLSTQATEDQQQSVKQELVCDTSSESDEYYDELDNYADHQAEFLEEPTGISASAKKIIFAYTPVWFKKMISSLIITLSKLPDYTSAQWKYIQRSLLL